MSDREKIKAGKSDDEVLRRDQVLQRDQEGRRDHNKHLGIGNYYSRRTKAGPRIYIYKCYTCSTRRSHCKV